MGQRRNVVVDGNQIRGSVSKRRRAKNAGVAPGARKPNESPGDKPASPQAASFREAGRAFAQAHRPAFEGLAEYDQR